MEPGLVRCIDGLVTRGAVEVAERRVFRARRVADPLWSALDGYFGSSMAEPISSLRAPAGSNWKWAVRGASADRGGEL